MSEYSKESANVIVHEDLTVSIIGENNDYDSLCIEGEINLIPVQFRQVYFFEAVGLGVESLIGSPYVAEAINFGDNKIKNWIGLSENVKQVFVKNNQLKSFKGMPVNKSDEGYLSIVENEIKSWEGFTNYNTVCFLNDIKVSSLSRKELEVLRDMIKTIPESIKRIEATLSSNNDINLPEMFVKKLANNFYEIDLKKVRNWQEVNSDSSLNLEGNPIESWEGFTSCGKLYWWKESLEINDNDNNLLLNAPKDIGIIRSTHYDYFPKSIIDSVDKYSVNMEKLRELQYMKKLEREKEIINNVIKIEDKNHKKRKL